MWAPLAVSLAASLLLAPEGFHLRPCPKPALPAEAWLRHLGMDVNLTCLSEKADNSSVSWKLQNQTLHPKQSNRVVTRGQLLLKSVQPRDSGNYSCYKDGHWVRSIQLLVGEALEKPKLSCYRRFPVSNIRCEWRPAKKLSSATKAVLQVQKGFNGELFTEACAYYQSKQVFSCRLRPSEDDATTYVVSMCVTNKVDSQGSNEEVLTGNNILQPDPPANVTVKAVERSPQKLTVSWQYPVTWRNYYYRLKFKIRYRAEHATAFTLVYSQETSILIADAWMGKKSVVQVQAREEFDHGLWSTWSPEVTGTPWAGNQDQGDLEMESTPTLFSDEAYAEDVTRSPFDEYYNAHTEEWEDTLSRHEPLVPRYVFFLAGASLALGVIFFMGIVIRYNKKWKRTLKGGKLSIFFHYSPVHLVPKGLKLNSNATAIFFAPSAPALSDIAPNSPPALALTDTAPVSAPAFHDSPCVSAPVLALSVSLSSLLISASTAYTKSCCGEDPVNSSLYDVSNMDYFAKGTELAP
ncbi:interleukin-6 receptor subunit alpha isoform X2 [Rhinatrema bivittatum]|uniref:interleukin-6 receptor subunit alpha isoform X2 n=1 Tax=Rhinatrema bivittatum TaxID=194408 RepID=UPI001129413D|nr:interleukin-6 receptor subunit alpha isoform X2 [Rhinatrema bivittatum]